MHGQRRVREDLICGTLHRHALLNVCIYASAPARLADHPHLKSPLHAFSHSHRSSLIRCGNTEVAVEYTWTMRLSASSYGLGGKIACSYTGSATTTCNNNVNCFETNTSGQTLVEYIYLGDMPLAMVRPTEQVYYYHNDRLGTPQVMTNASGAIAWKAAYNAFGNVIVDASSTITNNLRFPGQYYDTESGLHYNWNRYYDPNTGRYITADPIGLEGGISPYIYVDDARKSVPSETSFYQYSGNNPVNFIDPWGLYTTVTLYRGALNLGHIGIGVNTPVTTGFYPSRNASDIDVAIGNPVPGIMAWDTRTILDTIVIPTTQDQEQIVQNFINNRVENPGDYDLHERNCAHTVGDALRKAGFNVPKTKYPRSIIKYLKKRPW